MIVFKCYLPSNVSHAVTEGIQQVLLCKYKDKVICAQVKYELEYIFKNVFLYEVKCGHEIVSANGSKVSSFTWARYV